MPQLQQINVPRRQRRASNRGIAAIGAGITRAGERQERGQVRAAASQAAAAQKAQDRQTKVDAAALANTNKQKAAAQAQADALELQAKRAASGLLATKIKDNYITIANLSSRLMERDDQGDPIVSDNQRLILKQRKADLERENDIFLGIAESAPAVQEGDADFIGPLQPPGGAQQGVLQNMSSGGGGTEQQKTPQQDNAIRQTLGNIPKVIDRTVKPEKQPEAYRAYFNTHRQLVGGADLTDTEYANLLVAPAIGKRPIGPNMTDKVVKNRIKRENELSLGLKRTEASQRKNPSQMVDALGPILENAQPFNPLAADTKVNTKGLKTRAEWVDRIIALRDTDRAAAEALLVKFKAKFGE